MLGLLPLFALNELFALFTKKKKNCTAFSQSELSNFLIHIIKSVKSIVHVYILFGACSFCVLCFFVFCIIACNHILSYLNDFHSNDFHIQFVISIRVVSLLKILLDPSKDPVKSL